MYGAPPGNGALVEQNAELDIEAAAQIRSHWPGLFLWGGPDVAVVNVTKEAIWQRYAVRPEHARVSPPDPRELIAAGANLPDEIRIPDPKLPREKQQQQFLRDMEIDPNDFYPQDANRQLMQKWPEEGVIIKAQELIDSRGGVRSKADQ